MQYTTNWRKSYRRLGMGVHVLAVIGILALALSGTPLESSEGWVACPPVMPVVGEADAVRSKRRQPAVPWHWHGRAGWAYLERTWPVALARSEAVGLLLWWSGLHDWTWICLLPWGVWVWRGVGAACPALWGQWWYQAVDRGLDTLWRITLLVAGLVWAGHRLEELWLAHSGQGYGWALGGIGAVVNVKRDGRWYEVHLKGEFNLRVKGDDSFAVRILIVFLSLLEVPGEERGSRRTRDGRTPFVRQQQLAAWFGVPQPDISRWLRYWLERDWRRLLSQRTKEVLTLELQQRIIETWARFPWWGAERVWTHLQGQGVQVSLSQVRQAAQESGWSILKSALQHIYAISAESFRPRDEWLVGQLLTQMQEMVAQLEALKGLTPEQQVEIADLQAICATLEIQSRPPHRPLPWLLQVEHILFGHWEAVEDGTVRCIYCGSTDVSRKSRKPRLRKYVDAQGQEQTVEVYRYYCHNPACRHKSFTNLPPDLLPHSRYSLQWHVLALQMYEWGYSVYRRTGTALDVSPMTVYRWVSAFGYELLPVAALFGVVRSSGVVGVDEKYVLVPKTGGERGRTNDKPESEMKRWMYVYVAVDIYTYDLLHIAIYPYNTSQSATAFLLALRAKGYHPRVIVTDLRVDYGPVITRVFPQAIHHECIFHALQNVQELFKEVYGPNYAQNHPAAEQLKREIYDIFKAKTKRTAQKRYEAVMAQRQAFVAQNPDAVAIFNFLGRHWPKLLNAIESDLIPRTNNATEQVIRHFDQHYQNFCGFENIETARTYIAVFEKVYRFTPLTQDARPELRGKCPLELAGYEVAKLPMAQICRGWALQWPAPAFQELVPNV